MKKSHSGFTLIEILITFAVIALVTAIGLPYFQNSISRTKAVEIFGKMTEIKTELSAFAAIRLRFPLPQEQFYVEEFDVQNQKVIIHTYSAGKYFYVLDVSVNGDEYSERIHFVARLSEEKNPGFVTWQCKSIGEQRGSGVVTAKYAPPNCTRHYDLKSFFIDYPDNP